MPKCVEIQNLLPSSDRKVKFVMYLFSDGPKESTTFRRESSEVESLNYSDGNSAPLSTEDLISPAEKSL